ncbi:NAD-dependent protein deacetylase sirtuin-2 isoform X2 [Nematostella vectensis]|nr:NAD-dependent protein deacetylase sirtuin-2 isoform X2 [Nematostella vectensis]
MMKLFNQFRLNLTQEKSEKEKPEQLLDEVSFEGVANYIKSGKCKHIIVMTGAGISTAAGIPDFRSPGTGLYDNLQKYNLPYPESIFEIGYFRSNPEPFFALCKELYPGSFKPTMSHYFIKLLYDKKLLLRNYTQNVDTLERIAGVPDDLLVEAHGSFHTAHCIECKKEYTKEDVRDEIFADKVPRCSGCEGVIKPDIVFFGESLPGRFHRLVPQDMPHCDLIIIMGTSLAVQPFASLIDRVLATTPRLLINKEKCGRQASFLSFLSGVDSGFKFDKEDNYRDVAWLGTTDDGCLALAELLGWKEELVTIFNEGHAHLDKESRQDKAGLTTVEAKEKEYGAEEKPKNDDDLTVE